MTEIICPTCGARCEAKVVHGVVLKTHMTALSQPDLTKLRETFKDYIYAATRTEMLHMEPYTDKVIRAVKELLEEEDK